MTSATLQDAVAALRAGEIVCFPTESSFGLAVDAANLDALGRLRQLKQREEVFGLLVADLDMARSLCADWPSAAMQLATRHWPGPLTLAISARPGLPEAIVGPTGCVAMRVSPHPVAQLLVSAFGAPITATSANPHGQPPALDLQGALHYFGVHVKYLAGEAGGGPASTLAEVLSDRPVRVLRAGPIVIR